MSIACLLRSFAAGVALSALALSQGQPTLDQRLDKLALELEQAREQAHIPGMSIAIGG